ncbi:hypothetical protein IFO70_19690 [Phormidium tenue FACHB-886]|nr:hypothetical protein [Phormidium tenue FACHB-886]
MSSGHASHKGKVKHSHDTGQLDSAATTPSNPEDILDEAEGYPFNAQGKVQGEAEDIQPNPAATERPSNSTLDQEADK